MVRRGNSSSPYPSGVVCIGASEGGIDALCSVVAGLPADFPGAVLVVLHTSPLFHSGLPEILSKAGPLAAVHPSEGMPIQRGLIYVAPADRHMLIDRTKIMLAFGPKENFSRPAIDPLFRSAAQSWGGRATGVILTGNLSDGSAGLWTLQRAGGIAIIQDLADAKVPAMPRNAMAYVKPDYQLPAAQIGPVLAELAKDPRTTRALKQAVVSELENAAVRNQPLGPKQMGEFGRPSAYVCPECGGPLWKSRQGPPRMRCHAGHAYTAIDLIARYGDQKEALLWSAVRVLEEQALLMEEQAKKSNGTTQERKDMLMAARRNTDSAGVIRKLLSQNITFAPSTR